MLPRKDYPMVINTELQQIDLELKKLHMKLEAAGDEVRMEYRELIDLLRSKLRLARQKLKALEQASDENWEAAKADLDQTREALKSLLSNTAAQVS